jgi:hypothetical protein
VDNPLKWLLHTFQKWEKGLKSAYSGYLLTVDGHFFSVRSNLVLKTTVILEPNKKPIS